MNADRRGLAIFDLDGTLFRADGVTVPAVVTTFERHGLSPPPDDEIRGFIGRPTPELHAWLLSLCPPELGDRVVREVDAGEIEFVRQVGALYPGVPEALAAIRGTTHAMAICTNGPPAYVDVVIDSFGLRPAFDAVRCLESDGETKARMVADLLARLPARPAVMVGDRPVDIEAAHANGLPALAVTYGMCRPEELAAADALAHSPAELPALVMDFVRCPGARRGPREVSP